MLNIAFLSNMLGLFFVQSILEYLEDDLDNEVEYLHTTDDGEPSEESHGASNS